MQACMCTSTCVSVFVQYAANMSTGSFKKGRSTTDFLLGASIYMNISNSFSMCVCVCTFFREKWSKIRWK